MRLNGLSCVAYDDWLMIDASMMGCVVSCVVCE